MSFIDTMAVPAGVLAALIDATLIIKRARARRIVVVVGRHRRAGGRHRTLPA
ncbi:hypothetical protein [Nonomuraea insulae]|uniref:Uncharacterized protein n=1 Tax=Nonomuraea insulae TaxID=1616787 RepID=A0ABW1CWM7_9ACTN